MDRHGEPKTTGLAALAQLEVELSALANADPNGWSQDELNKLKEFLAAANTNMVGVLDAEKTADQQEWNGAAAQRKSCHDTAAKRFVQGGDVFFEAAARDSKRGVHKACRKLEVKWNSVTSAAAECDDSAALVWTDDSPPALSTSLATLHAAMDAFVAEKSSYKAVDSSQPTCSAAQLDYESQYCSWRKSRRFACQAEASCITQLDMTSRQNTLQTRVTQRRSLRLTLTKLICQMNHLLNTFQSENSNAPEDKSDFALANNCNETTVDDVLDDLDFTLEASTYCASDADVSLYPSDASCTGEDSPWLTDATFGYDWDASYVVPSTCRHTCLDAPAVVPSAPLIAGCADSAAEASDCLMFQHHTDACQHDAYKVDGFDPATDCCVCGGGTTTTTTTTTTTAATAGTCTCEFTIDNYVAEVYVDGSDVTSQVSGDLQNWPTKKTLVFECNAQTLFAINGADAEHGCSTGDFAIKCTSTNSASPWNGLTADQSWKAFGGQCHSGGCTRGIADPPANWYSPSFDDSSWKAAATDSAQIAATVVSPEKGVCSHDGSAWLFRSPSSL